MLPLIFLLSLTSPLNALEKVGEAEFSVMFIDIYDIALYSQTGSYNRDTDHYSLQIEYHRNVSAERLVELTVDQWEHLGAPISDIQQYGPVLRKLWPDVRKGDSLTIYVTPDNSDFFHNDRAIGSIDDPGFGKLFTDIWLSAKTSAPRIREDLLGQDAN